jgi:hypothetical protein
VLERIDTTMMSNGSSQPFFAFHSSNCSVQSSAQHRTRLVSENKESSAATGSVVAGGDVMAVSTSEKRGLGCGGHTHAAERPCWR